MPKYEIINSYLDNVSFVSHRSPGLWCPTKDEIEMTVNLTVKSYKEDDDSYMVYLTLEVSPTAEGKTIYDLKVVYAAIVGGVGLEVDAHELMSILNVDVPAELYAPLRNVVWTITQAAGVPPLMLDDYSFAPENAKYQSTNEALYNAMLPEEERDKEVEEEMIDYDWMLRELCSTEEGKKLFDTLVQTTNGDITVYEKSPLYRYYLRFFHPMGFKHPPLNGCNYRTWNMVFQLLFAVGEKVELSANENYIPDLNFYDSALGNCSMINLTRAEFKIALSHLVYKAFAEIAVKLSGMDIDEELAEKIDPRNQILKHDLMCLFNCCGDRGDDERRRFVEKLYERIEYYNSQCFMLQIY